MSQIITIARGGEGLSGDGVAFVFVLCFVLYLTPGISHLAMNLLTSSILSSYYIAHVSQAGKVLSSPPIGRWTSLSRSRSTPTGEASLTALFLLLRPANQPTNQPVEPFPLARFLPLEALCGFIYCRFLASSLLMLLLDVWIMT